tara:strand:+ start:148 stop:426 length:279 start_codon:yes stop_codon:yes gene_type:complete
MPTGIKALVDGFDQRLRANERKLEKCELREKQIIIMFKSLLDATSRNVRHARGGMTIQKIIEYLEKLIEDNIPPEEKREPEDLISELIKKGK